MLGVMWLQRRHRPPLLHVVGLEESAERRGALADLLPANIAARLDERVEDGLYAGYGLKHVKRLVEEARRFPLMGATEVGRSRPCAG